MDQNSLNKTAFSATVHCLTGCSIGEVLGMVIGTAYGFTNLATTVLAVTLAFIFGYALSLLPLRRAGLTFAVAMPIVFASDTLSIATMEIVDNAIMLSIPGAMDEGLANPIFWVSLPVALIIAGFAAYPVNRYLLTKGKGHALLHKYMGHDEHKGHEHHHH